MNYVKIGRSVAVGDVILPASKSILHRAYICAALSKGVSVIHGTNDCDDVNATLDCIGSLGALYERKKDKTVIIGNGFMHSSPLRCRESASTLRLLLPLMLCGKKTEFICDGALSSRPMDVYRDICGMLGADYVNQDGMVSVCGILRPGEYRVRADISSQFISGLMLALPLVDGNSRIIFTTEPKSKGYMLITQKIMSLFGVNVEVKDDCVNIAGGRHYSPATVIAEADESCAAYIGAFNCIGGSINIKNRAIGSIQGDSVWQDVFDELCRPDPVIDIKNTPDLAPVLMALAALKNGVVLQGTDRLRYKESDRGYTMARAIRAFGADVSFGDDSITVMPAANGLHEPNTPLDPCGDHRICMALSLMCSVCGGNICDPTCVAKSYKNYFDDLNSLGIKTEICEIQDE